MPADRLVLDRPQLADQDEIFEIYSDPRVWTHFPSGRFTESQQAKTFLRQRIADWEIDSLGTWIVREVENGPIIGHCGCAVRRPLTKLDETENIDPRFWNLGYRFRPEFHGRGYAARIGREAIVRAHELQPDLPVIAYLLEHNRASARVAEKLGLSLEHRGRDAGNPDLEAIRLVYADRALTPEQLAAALL